MRRTRKELDAKVFFQLPDRARQRRLFNVQALRYSRKMKFLSNRDKAAKMSKLQSYRSF